MQTHQLQLWNLFSRTIMIIKSSSCFFLLLVSFASLHENASAFSRVSSGHHDAITSIRRRRSRRGSGKKFPLKVAKIEIDSEWAASPTKGRRRQVSSNGNGSARLGLVFEQTPNQVQQRKIKSSAIAAPAASTSSTSSLVASLDATRRTSGCGASMPTLSVSLVKSIVGGGVLALPSGFAAMGGSPDIVPAAMCTIVACGALNAFYFGLVGKVCHETGATSFRQAWERTVGPSTATLVATVVTLKTALACVAYGMILADSGQALCQAAGLVDVTRTQALLALTGTVLVPLTLRRDLTSLAPFSFIGLMGVLLTTYTVVKRYQDGSYLPETGMYAHDLPAQLQPSLMDHAAATVASSDLATMSDALAATTTASTSMPTDMGWPGVVLACTLATAFVAHYNAPRFYNELQEPSVERFQTVTFASYGVAAVVFVIVGVCGFLTFGQASQGYILSNYSPMDPLATLSKTALTCSILATFPLPFVGLRDGVLDLLQVSNRDQVHSVTTIALLAAITAGALSLHDLALVLSVGGGTFSTAVSAVFPVLMFLSMDSDNKATWEQVAAAMGMVLSVGIGFTGVNLALAKAAATAAAVAT